MRYSRSDQVRLSPAQATRQGDLIRTAMLVLGRDDAIAFLNADHEGLGGRPIDVAIASEEGIGRVERILADMTYRTADPIEE